MLKTANFIFNIIQESTDEIYDICKGKDLIVVTHSHMGAVEAEALGIPTKCDSSDRNDCKETKEKNSNRKDYRFNHCKTSNKTI